MFLKKSAEKNIIIAR